ncbi:MAG: M14 family metallopeptidase [Bacteroidales bacterium]|nr:M14 family metallopeptidase [Bacteroidales bacterium]
MNYKFSIVVLLIFFFFGNMSYSQPQTANVNSAPASIEYYLSDGEYHFDPSIPTPFEVLGYNVGEHYADWNDILIYMNALDKVSDKVSLKYFGKTFQDRRYLQVYITSADNQKRLEQIHKEHIDLTDADASGRLDISKMPVIVNLMASMHGNEASGVNSQLILAYYFTACTDAKVKEILDNEVIILTPGLNLDGINRFASWVNTTRSLNYVADLNSREFAEPWPSSRTNHYWADCNRDWLSTQYPEGKNGVEMYLEWYPNVVLDQHEQGGSEKGFYFSPGDANRTYKDIPQKNQDLTLKIAKNTAKAFDRKGVLYFTKEGYDDFFIGKGAAYGDLLGSVSILHEQVATRGYLRPTAYGNMSFASSVRNQSVSAISIVCSALDMREELLDYQREFYVNQKKAAAADVVKGYQFKSKGSKALDYLFIQNMQNHKVDVYRSNKDKSAYVIPLNQKNYYTIKSMMDDITEYNDSTFYDISTWTFPRAYNLDYTQLKSLAGVLGEKITLSFPEGSVECGKSNIAYAFEQNEFYTPYVISELLKNGLFVKVSRKPFNYEYDNVKKHFTVGTIVVPVYNQSMDSDKIYALVSTLAKKSGVEILGMQTGFMKDFDLGSSMFKPVREPKVALIVGKGMGTPDSGEIWYLLDKRFNINHTLIEATILNGNIDLSKYNVMIFANGNPSGMSPAAYEKINGWVRNGGTLIVTGNAVEVSNKAKLTNIETITNRGVSGVIMNAKVSVSSPLGWGYKDGVLPLFKMNANVYNKVSGSTVMSYTSNPYLSGCISQKNIDKIAGSPVIITDGAGSGNVIFISNDMNFRSYWLGTTKLFMNAILFGNLL